MVGMQRAGGRTRLARACGLVVVFFLWLGWPAQSPAYSVLAHEAIIDSAWDANIRPLLLKRFPDATGEELKEAHGYAYGGAIIQDMGYYPHGSHFFERSLISPLRAQRRLYSGSAARFRGPERLRFCTRGALSLRRGQRRPSHGHESCGAHPLSQVEEEIRRLGYLRTRPAGARKDGIWIRRSRSRAGALRSG